MSVGQPAYLPAMGQAARAMDFAGIRCMLAFCPGESFLLPFTDRAPFTCPLWGLISFSDADRTLTIFFYDPFIFMFLCP
jgi:hypothetical protein